jgi:hypothetical protein
MTFIRKRTYPQGKVVVVRIDGTEPASIAEAGYQRLIKELDAARVEFTTVELAGLPAVVRRLVRDADEAWYLPGCFGVIDKKHVLAPVGSEAIAVVAKSCGARVAILAEIEKVAMGDELSRTLDELIGDALIEVRVDGDCVEHSRMHSKLDVLKNSEFDTIVGPDELVNESVAQTRDA